MTEKANKAITLAEQESCRLGHNFVGTEQILIGLFLEGEGIAARALKSMGATLHVLRVEAEKIIGRGTGSGSSSLALTPRTKKLMELSWEEAQNIGDNYIDTEHLLLGLLRENKGSAAKVLAGCGIDAANLRAQVYRLLDKKESISTINPSANISETPTLDQFSESFKQASPDEDFDPVVARDKEINRVIRILGRKDRANPLLLGERGAGKSAVVAELARRIEAAEVPDYLLGRKILRLDVLYLLAHRESSNLMKECLAEARAGKIILLIDEFHKLLSPGKNLARQDVSYILNWFLSHAGVTCIATAPLPEFRRTAGKQGVLARHFQPVLINPAGPEDALAMLNSLKGRLEKHHEVSISDAAVEAAVRLSDETITSGFLPDKAVNVLDEACRLVSLRHPSAVALMKSNLAKIRREKDICIRSQQFARAASLREQEASLVENLQNAQIPGDIPIVSRDDIVEVINQWSGI